MVENMDVGRRKERPEGGPIADALAVEHPALFYRTTVWKLDTQDRSPSSEEEAAEKIDVGLRAALAG